ncbi:hypothetical protein BN1058_00428 [Paraliobacillus sp. PM-2]|uniref:AimR family lysis-lysogeny pheromone receptor n=1 Tax=Paraliobacillus sp. PM-2 TaxID=1462524 RepID=UPI00061CD9E1|nr:AimR family lysis-lysogeny pheromone receptor [Paraliobacillus sp. PM-2]CQR46177.1 hypothetical protein BN1058_00428 [Paraliobacillus sp. PM-2]
MRKDISFPEQNIKDYQDLRLDQFIQILSIKYDEKVVIELAKDFCLQMDNEEDLRVGMEFLYIHGYYHELDKLIEKNKKSQNLLNRKWAEIFKLTMARVHRKLPHDEILQRLNRFEIEDNDSQCLLLINKLNIYFDLYQYGALGNILGDLQHQIQQVNNPLLAYLYNYCLELLLFVFYWKRNALLLSRKYGFRVLNKVFNKKVKAHLHLNLSLTYIFDDFESSMHHLKEARKIAEKFQENRLLHMIDNQNYPFICAHFNRTEGVVSDNVSEQAHLEIARGNLKKAQALLSGITEVTPFTKYYLGRAHQDRKYFINAYNDFIEKQSDHFFARLPLLEMKDD